MKLSTLILGTLRNTPIRLKIVNYNNSVYRILDEYKNKFDELDKQIIEMNLKLSDLNVLELMSSNKGVEGEEDSNKLNDIIRLIQDLEKRNIKRCDEIVKKYDDEIAKLRNEMLAIKNTSDQTNIDLNNLKNTIDGILVKLEALNKTVEHNYELSINHCRENNSTLKKLIHDEVEELKKMIAGIQIADLGKKEGMSEEDMQLLKDLVKRVTELEKNLKLLSKSINLDPIMSEIHELKDNLQNKANLNELEYIREKQSKYY
jgi:hypothetical protein